MNRVLLYHDGSPDSSDLFQSVLTALDPLVTLDFVARKRPIRAACRCSNTTWSRPPTRPRNRRAALAERVGANIVQLVKERGYGLVILWDTDEGQTRFVRKNASCPVFTATMPAIPTEAAAQ